MEQYLRRNRLASFADGAGVLLLIYGAATMWFAWLWGLGVPSLLAGAALGTMLAMARSCLRRGRVARREEALRCRLGAELAMEEILLADPREAHSRMALLVAEKWPVTILSARDEGVLCRQGEEKLLIVCVRMPPEGSLSAGDLVAGQRAVRRSGAERGVLCVMGRTSSAMLAKAEQTAVPLRIVQRETLMEVAGRLFPATDEQLIALGRRRRPAGRGGVMALVFRRDKARRYFSYGLVMTLLYVLTGVRVYAVPGLVCLTMAIFCRTGPGTEEKL